MKQILIAILLCCSVLALAADEFAKYPSESKLRGSPARPQLVTARARKFRAVLRDAAAQGANFNGHYRITYWGCGSNCVEWAVINLRNGNVWFAAEPAVSCYAPDEPENVDVPDWFANRSDSRLFYLHQCSDARRDRTFDRRYVYVWSSGPKLIRTDQLK